MPTLTIKKVSPLDSALWHGVLIIYRAAFPDWEREPEDVLAERICAGRYVMYCAVDTDNSPLGFYILDINTHPSYALFCFLAVDEKCRGLGYGTKLCCDAVSRFHNEYSVDWLLIEAEDRQAIFYGRLGFKKVGIPYFVPTFGGDDTVPMHLMLISASPDLTVISGDSLIEIIRHMFITGYYLNAEDERIEQQINHIPKQAQLLSWPQ